MTDWTRGRALRFAMREREQRERDVAAPPDVPDLVDRLGDIRHAIEVDRAIRLLPRQHIIAGAPGEYDKRLVGNVTMQHQSCPAGLGRERYARGVFLVGENGTHITMGESEVTGFPGRTAEPDQRG